MLRQSILLAVCGYPTFLWLGAQEAKKYQNNVYYFSINIPTKSRETLTIVEPRPPEPAHGFTININDEIRSIVIYSSYNSTFEGNTPESFHVWLRDESVTNMRTLSWGPYNKSGLMGYRAISIQSSEDKGRIVIESIRIFRPSKSTVGSPGIWYEFRLNSDVEHYIEDSNVFNQLICSFKTTRSKYFK